MGGLGSGRFGKRVPTKVDQELMKEIYDKRQEGNTIAVLSDIFGKSRPTIQKKLKQYEEILRKEEENELFYS